MEKLEQTTLEGFLSKLIEKTVKKNNRGYPPADKYIRYQVFEEVRDLITKHTFKGKN